MENNCANEMCCCKCKHQRPINKHPFNKGIAKGEVTEQLGYVCLNPDFAPTTIFLDREHGMCEMFDFKAEQLTDLQ